MSDEQNEQQPAGVQRQEMPGYVREVKLYEKVCALPGCGVKFLGRANRRYCSQQHAVKARDLKNPQDVRERQRRYRLRRKQGPGTA